MKGTDKFLIVIVVGMVVLVGVVLAIALLQPRQPTYKPDDLPENIAHNYLLALQLEDYERAYGYLSPTIPSYPANAERFTADVKAHPWTFSGYNDDVSLAIESIRVTGDRATVTARETVFRRRGLFDGGQYNSTFEMTMHSENGDWQVVESGRYWYHCWNDPDRYLCR